LVKKYRLPHGIIYVNKSDITKIIMDHSGTFELKPGQARFVGSIKGLDIKTYFSAPEFWDARLAAQKVVNEKGHLNILMKAGRIDKFGDQIMITVIPAAYVETYGIEAVNFDILIPKSMNLIWEGNTYIRNIFNDESEISEEYDVQFSVDNLEMKFDCGQGSCIDILLHGSKLSLVNKTPIYKIKESEKKKAKSYIGKMKRPIIGIGLESAAQARTYPRMGDVSRLLKDKGYSIIILDDRDDNGEYQFSFREMAAIVGECDVILTADSGILHLAGALKKKIVGVFGHTDGRIFTEAYEKAVFIQADCPYKKSPCWWAVPCLPGESYEEKASSGYSKCLSLLEPEKIIEKVEEQLNPSKKILILMLTYNLLDMTKKALASIRSFHDYDIFIVDNESDDGTQEWLREKGFDFISKKTSVAAAQNIGLQKFLSGDYDYLLLLNNDLVLRYDTIDQLVRCLDNSGAWAAMSTEIPGTPPWGVDAAKPRGLGWEEIRNIPAGSYSCTLFTREAIEKTGFFNERFEPRYIEDNDYTLRLRLAGGRFVRAEGAIYFHVLGGVVKMVEGEKAKYDENWNRNVGIFKEIWGIHPHEDQKLEKLGLEWRRDVSYESIKDFIDKQGKAVIRIERRMGGYGDILFTTVLARALREKFNDNVEINYYVPDKFVSLLNPNPYIDNVFPVGTRGSSDFRIDLTDLEFRVELQEMREFGEIRSARTEIYLNTIGLDGSLKPYYFVTDEEREWAETIWPNSRRPRIAMVMKGSNKLKVWPHMRALFDKLSKRKNGGSVYIVYDDDDNAPHSFREAAAIVSTADFVISPDTGISNLAGTIDIPVLTIFSNRNGKIFEKMFDSMISIQGHCPFYDDKNYCDFFVPCMGGGPHRAKENIDIPECLKRLSLEEMLEKVEAVEELFFDRFHQTERI